MAGASCLERLVRVVHSMAGACCLERQVRVVLSASGAMGAAFCLHVAPLIVLRIVEIEQDVLGRDEVLDVMTQDLKIALG